MDRYRTVWHAVACALLITGFVGAVLLLPAATLIFAGLVCAVLLPLAGAVIYAAHDPENARALLSKSMLVQAGVAVGLGMIALLGFLDTLGGVALQLPVLLILTCPAAMRRLVGRPAHHRSGPAQTVGSRRALPGPAPTPPMLDTPEAELVRYGALSDSDLCRQWRQSFTDLQRAGGPAELARLSQTRRELLDELARRDPAGFDRWLNNGARAASDPARYLRRTRQ